MRHRREGDEENECENRGNGDVIGCHGFGEGNFCDEMRDGKRDFCDRVVPLVGNVSIAEEAHNLQREDTPLDNEGYRPLVHVVTAHRVKVQGPSLQVCAHAARYGDMVILSRERDRGAN